MTQTPPNQTLHIFAKDARRFLPEIVISLALLAAFAYVAPLVSEGRSHHDDSLFFLSTILQSLLYVLIPISWWVLVSRVVHEENLVGDRQFWITRPYRWPSLLAAKLLFFAAFILFPFAIMQAAILSVIGLHPQSLVPGILYGAFLLGGCVVLPFWTLSTITKSVLKMTIILLGFVFFLIALFLGFSVWTGVGIMVGGTNGAWASLSILVLACISAVVLQYARRRTLVSRLLLAGTIVFIILWSSFCPSALNSLGYRVPIPSRPAPIVAFDPAPERRTAGESITPDRDYLTVALPLSVGSASNNVAIAGEIVKMTVTTSTGLSYTSPWTEIGENVYRPAADNTLPIRVPVAFFDQVKFTPVKVYVTLGVAQLRVQRADTVPFPAHRAEIPGLGICSGDRNSPDYDGSNFGLSCDAALRSSALTYITAEWSDVPCNRAQPPTDHLIGGDAYIGTLDGAPAEFGLSPLVHQQINFSNGAVSLPNNGSRQRYLCAGTPIVLTSYTTAFRTTVGFTTPEISLADYMPKSIQPPGSVVLPTAH